MHGYLRRSSKMMRPGGTEEPHENVLAAPSPGYLYNKRGLSTLPFRRAFGLSECFKPGSDKNHAENADLHREGAMWQAPACSAAMHCRKWDLSVGCACSWVRYERAFQR